MLLLMFIPVSAAAPENKMNVAVICGTDDARKSTQKMQKVLAKNKLPHWRLNKQIPYYYDCSDRPATHSSVNQILDQAFGDSTENDINYLFFAAHGYPGTMTQTRSFSPIPVSYWIWLTAQKKASTNSLILLRS